MSNIAARLERLPLSSVHYRLFAMGALGYLFDSLNGVIFSFVLPILRTEWSISSVELGVLASSQSMGYLIGALFAGTLGDLIGRRPVMMWSLAMFTLLTTACALAQSWPVMFWLRIVQGIGAGAEAAIVTPYLLEFCPRHYRGRFAGGLASFFGLGNICAALVGYLIVPLSPWAWRAALIVTSLPIFMLAWWRRSLPESPRWLESRSRTPEAEAIMDKMEQEVVRRHGPLPPLSTVAGVPVPPRIGHGNILRNVATLWSQRLARITLMSWILWFSVSFCFWAFTNWIPSLLVAHGMTVTKSFTYSLGIYAANLPGYYAAAYLNDKIGRQATVASFLILAGLCAVGMAFAGNETEIFVAGVLLAFFMNGSYGGVYAYTPEIYPTDLRTTGTGVASAFGRTGAILSPILVGYIFPLSGFYGVFGMIAGVLALGAGAVIVLGVPTRGRSLEQITAEELGAGSAGAATTTNGRSRVAGN